MSRRLTALAAATTALALAAGLFLGRHTAPASPPPTPGPTPTPTASAQAPRPSPTPACPDPAVLHEDLAQARAALAVCEDMLIAAEDELTGRPIPPRDPAEAREIEADLRAALETLVEAEDVDVLEIRAVDCTEYPCVVLAALPRDGDLRQAMADHPATADLPVDLFGHWTDSVEPQGTVLLECRAVLIGHPSVEALADNELLDDELYGFNDWGTRAATRCTRLRDD